MISAGAVRTVDHVDSTLDNGSYGQGVLLPITVTFSDGVNVTGSPYLELNMSGVTRLAYYASGSGTSDLVFTYRVVSPDTASDLDYVAIDSLKLNGGTIKEPNNTDAILELPAVGSANSLGGQKNLRIMTRHGVAMVGGGGM